MFNKQAFKFAHKKISEKIIPINISTHLKWDHAVGVVYVKSSRYGLAAKVIIYIREQNKRLPANYKTPFGNQVVEKCGLPPIIQTVLSVKIPFIV